MEEFNRFHH